MHFNSFTRSFPAISETFQDRYFNSGGQLRQQTLTRNVFQPDIRFSAAELTEVETSTYPFNATLDSQYPVAYRRQTSTGFLNMSVENGGISGAGPGIVPPDRRIFFNTTPTVLVDDPFVGKVEYGFKWAAYDTTSLISHPFGTVSRPDVTLTRPSTSTLTLSIPTEPFTFYSLQSSIDLTTWQTLTNFSGEGGNMSFVIATPNQSASRVFYRFIAP